MYVHMRKIPVVHSVYLNIQTMIIARFYCECHTSNTNQVPYSNSHIHTQKTHCTIHTNAFSVHTTHSVHNNDNIYISTYISYEPTVGSIEEV
jgi:hypothetical protein